MSKLLINNRLFKLVKFTSEKELERVVVKNYALIFGDKTVYFDIKKRVKSKKGGLLSIPDGYLISFAEEKPKLYVIENEISSHDAYKDIGIQLWKFVSSFKERQMAVKKFLSQEINSNKSINEKINKFLIDTSFPNISELLDFIIFDQSYGFIVVIDEETEDLDLVLNQLANPPEVIEIKKYIAEDNPKEITYRFSEFLEEIKGSMTGRINISDIDTIVCPAREEGFKETFLGENRWYAIRISPSVIPQIKYIAMYETAPVSAIRWIGVVSSIKPYKDTGKYEIKITEKRKLPKELKLTPEEGKRGVAPQAPRYTQKKLIDKAKKLRDIVKLRQ